jgi:hypothetical protein
MMQPVTTILLVCLISSPALAETPARPKGQLVLFKSEHSAQQRCRHDRIVWANTRAHTLHLAGDHHYAHTHGGFACEAEARAHGYRGPSAHT